MIVAEYVPAEVGVKLNESDEPLVRFTTVPLGPVTCHWYERVQFVLRQLNPPLIFTCCPEVILTCCPFVVALLLDNTDVHVPHSHGGGGTIKDNIHGLQLPSHADEPQTGVIIAVYVPGAEGVKLNDTLDCPVWLGNPVPGPKTSHL